VDVDGMIQRHVEPSLVNTQPFDFGVNRVSIVTKTFQGWKLLGLRIRLPDSESDVTSTSI
jgi:hypothetical protein